MKSSDKIDLLEERVNAQERLLIKVRKDLINVRSLTDENYRKSKIKKIIDYLNTYKETGIGAE